MTRVQRRRRWGPLLLMGVAVGIFVGAMQQAVRGLLSGELWSWAEMGLYGVVWAVVMPPVWWLVFRAVDGGRFPQSPSARVRAQQSKLVSPALAAGALPADADPTVWRPALDGEVRDWSGQRWLFVVFTVVGAGSIGAAAVVANGNDWRVWAVALVVAAEGLVAFRWSKRQLRTARLLVAELATR